jgi:hypothetical protein
MYENHTEFTPGEELEIIMSIMMGQLKDCFGGI